MAFAPSQNDIIQQLAMRSASPQTALDAQQNQQIADMLAAGQTQGADHSANPVAFGANLGAALLNHMAMKRSNQALAQDAALDQSAMARQALGTIGMGGAAQGGAPAPPPMPPAPLPTSAPSGGAQNPAMLSAMLSGDPTGGVPSPSAAPPPTGAPSAPPAAQGGPGMSPGAGAPPAPPPSMQATPPPMQTAQGPPQGFGGAAGAAPSPGVGPPVTAQDRDALIRMVYGEARGEHPDGQAATAAVALNRSILSGHPVSAVVNAPGQFEGMKAASNLDPRSPQYQKIAAVVDPLLSGSAQDPSGGATHFYAPAAQAALGRAPPAWAQSAPGRQIGNQMFYNLASGGGQPQLQQASMPIGQGGGQQPQLPAPQTIAPQGPQGAPQIAYGQGPTQQEQAIIGQMMSSPYQAMRDQGMAMIGSIRQRMLAPIDYDDKFDPSTGQTVYVPKTPGSGPVQYAGAPGGYQRPAADNMMYGPDGVQHPLAGTTMSAPVRVSPQATAQADPSGKVTYSAVPGLAGEAPAGTAWNGSAYAPVPGAQVTQEGSFAPNSVVQRSPNGSASVVQQPEFGVKDAGAVLQDIGGSEPFKNALKSGEMYRSLVQASQRPGGIPDAELKDTAAQVLSGGVARQFGAKMLEEGGGPLASLRQFAPALISGQRLAPNVRQAIVQAVRDKAIGDDASYRDFVGARSGYIKNTTGQDIAPYANGMLKYDIPEVPSLSSIPTGMGGVQGGGGNRNPSSGGYSGPVVGGVPAPRSPQEAHLLPSGTRIRLPDGQMGVVP